MTGPDGAPIDLADVTFVDVETDRGGKLLAVGAVRGERYAGGAANHETILRVAELAGGGAVGGHNAVLHDVPVLARAGFRVEAPVLDTLLLAMFADPVRASQRVIAGLREGDPLEIDTRGERARLTANGDLVCVLSTAGSARLARVLERGGRDVVASVHEIFVHLRREGGVVKGTSLVVLPTICASEGGGGGD